MNNERAYTTHNPTLYEACFVQEKFSAPACGDFILIPDRWDSKSLSPSSSDIATTFAIPCPYSLSCVAVLNPLPPNEICVPAVKPGAERATLAALSY